MFRMYTWEYLKKPLWNNALSFERRQQIHTSVSRKGDNQIPQLYIPALKKINSFDEIGLLPPLSTPYKGGDLKIAFEDFDGVLQSCTGLRYFYEIPPLSLPLAGEQKLKAPIYLFDNHNHAYYFWYLARSQGIIQDGATLYHIDEHSDMRDPEEYLLKPDSLDMQKVYEYTNYVLNVGNYIIPAQQEGLIGEIVQIRNEENLLNYRLPSSPLLTQEGEWKGVVLNLDLDFFEPALDFIDYDLKKQVVLDIAKKADIITVATSPFFIDQELALKVFRDLFWK